jgi:hypothetical protein
VQYTQARIALALVRQLADVREKPIQSPRKKASQAQGLFLPLSGKNKKTTIFFGGFLL